MKVNNSVSLKTILDHHNIRFDSSNKIVCPFKSHKGGKENSASFTYYQTNDSFYCWGCQNGGRSLEFIAAFYDIDKKEAYKKLINEYEPEELNITDNTSDWLEKQLYLFKSANIIREFIQKYNNNSSLIYIEKITKEIDYIFEKHKDINSKAYNVLIKELERKIKEYK